MANNTTTISWNMQIVTTNGSISSSASKSWSVTVNGTTYSGSNTLGSISTNTTKTLASGSTTISHNSDGTKTFSYSFSQQFSITYNGTSIGTISGSGSGTLDTIARASSVSATNANIGSASTITISRASSSFTHTLRYSFCNLSGTIVSKTSSTSYNWTLPTTFYAQIPNSSSSWGTIYCDTYVGSTLVGTKSCTFNVYVANSNPTLSPTVVDGNSTTTALTGDSNKFVKYYSSANFTIGATAKNSATISSQKVSCGAKSSTSSSGTLSNVESATFTFTATDSRGFSTTSTVTKTLISYVKLTCTMSSNTPTADGEMIVKATGNYFDGSFGSVSNTLSVQYRYKISGGSYGDWTDLTITKSGNTYTATSTLTGLDYQTNYVFQCRAVDKLATVSTSERTVKATPIFDWSQNDFNFHVGVVSNQSFRIGADKYLYGTNTDGNPTTIARINPTNNATEIGSSTLNTVIKAGENPTWYSYTYSGTYNIWTDKDCTSTADSICRTWRYPNGMQVSVVKVYGTWNITTAWGSVYSSPWISGQSFNVAFSEAPKVTVNAYNASSAIMVCQCSGPTTTATGAFYLWKPVSQTGVKSYIEFIAVGRWK